MISMLNGVVFSVTVGKIVLDVQCVGYQVFVPDSVTAGLTAGERLQLHTHLVVREDAMTLFGFTDEMELGIFEVLLGVNGVGAKTALAILSSASVSEIVQAVQQENAKVFQAVSGIGPKTAKLIVVSLQGKFDRFKTGAVSIETPAKNPVSAISSRVVEALIGLGWAEKEAISAVENAQGAGAGDSEQDLLRGALRLLQGVNNG